MRSRGRLSPEEWAIVILWSFDRQYRVSLTAERILDCGVRKDFSSLGQSSGRYEWRDWKEGVEAGDAEKPVCLRMFPITEDSFRHKCQKVHLIPFKPVRNVLDLLQRNDG